MAAPQQNINAGRAANQAPGAMIPGAQAPAPAAAPPSSLSTFAAPPPARDFMSLYQQGLEQAKSGIAQRLQGDLGYIQKQQQAAGQAIGQLPGGINAAYGQAQQTNQNSENAISAAQKASGVGSLMPLGSYMAPVNAAIRGSQTADLQNVPLLQIGAQQMGDQQRAMAMQGAASDQSALQAQQMQFYQQQAAAQDAAKQSQDAASANSMQNYAYSKMLQDDKNKAYPPNAASTYGDQQVNDSKGVPQGYTPNEFAAAKKSPQYSRASSLITQAQAEKSPQKSAQLQAETWFRLQQVYKDRPAILAALASLFPGGQPPTPIAQAAPTGASWMLNHLDMSGSGSNSPLHR